MFYSDGLQIIRKLHKTDVGSCVSIGKMLDDAFLLLSDFSFFVYNFLVGSVDKCFICTLSPKRWITISRFKLVTNDAILTGQPVSIVRGEASTSI